MTKKLRHFLDLDQMDVKILRDILDIGCAYKTGDRVDTPMEGKTLAMIFEKPSTRTRVSFEVAAHQLGGQVVILDDSMTQLGRGETIADTARVLSRYVDAIMIRTDNPEKLIEMAKYATVPVINGLTDASHPCQLLADIMTFEEHKSPIKDAVVAWVGDGNNVATSWIHAAVRFCFNLRLACPTFLAPRSEILDWAKAEKGKVKLVSNPEDAVLDADCVVTDTWISMGNVDATDRRNLLISYQVSDDLMNKAKPNALFMHCLPAHRGEEVVSAVIDGSRSVVWDEAENRLHVQKGILAWCLS